MSPHIADEEVSFSCSQQPRSLVPRESHKSAACPPTKFL